MKKQRVNGGLSCLFRFPDRKGSSLLLQNPACKEHVTTTSKEGKRLATRDLMGFVIQFSAQDLNSNDNETSILHMETKSPPFNF